MMPRACLRCWALLPAALLFLAGVGARADGFRCGQRLVNTGDSKEQVQVRCGQPQSQDRWVEEEISYDTDQAGHRIQRVVTIPVDRWVYNLGPTSFLRILLFRRGHLTEIQVGDRGGP